MLYSCWKFVIVDLFTHGCRQNYRQHIIIYVCIYNSCFKFLHIYIYKPICFPNSWCAYLLYQIVIERVREGKRNTQRTAYMNVFAASNDLIYVRTHDTYNNIFYFLKLSYSMILHVRVNAM